MATAHQLLAALAGHIGREKGITATHLAARIDVPPRRVRQLVTELRLDGEAVCGHPSTGYYMAATAEEVEETCQFLRARAMHSLTLESRLRKIPLPDLVGQLKLRT